VATLNITIESLQLEYRTVLDAVLKVAVASKPRGYTTYDAGYTVIEITVPQLPQLPVETGRGVSIDIAAIEALQLIAGEGAHDAVLRVAPQFKEYADARPYTYGKEPMFHGNYGDRMNTTMVSGQHDCGAGVYHFSWLECAVHKIKTDRDTRQAVINLWSNELDNAVSGKKDYPCTVAIGFRIFRGQLDMHVTMRSNDAWKGLPYDVFQFNQAHLTVATMLSVPLGRYYHNAWSLHLYDADLDNVKNVYDRTYLSDVVLPRGFNHSTDAMSVLNNSDPADYHSSATQEWYARRLYKYLEPTQDETAEKTDDV